MAIWEIKWPLKDLVTHVVAPHVEGYISSSSNRNSRMASEAGKLYGTEKTKDVLQRWHWASIAKSSGWSSERSFPATCVPSSWRLNSRIQDAMLNAGKWPEAKVGWINEKNVRIHLDLEKAWLNAETLVKWQLFSGAKNASYNSRAVLLADVWLHHREQCEWEEKFKVQRNL